MPIRVVEIHHHGIRIDGDEAGLAANLDFYQGVLGLSPDPGRSAFLGIPGFWMNVGETGQICRGLKIPRCGLISGVRSLPNSNPPARSLESSTPPRSIKSRLTWLNAAWSSSASWLAGSIARQPVPDLADLRLPYARRIPSSMNSATSWIGAAIGSSEVAPQNEHSSSVAFSSMKPLIASSLKQSAQTAKSPSW